MAKNELAVNDNIKTSMVNLTDFKSMGELEAHCQKLIDSRYLPSQVKTPAQAMLIAQMGAELGLPMVTSFNNINVIQGKPVLGWRGQVALVQSQGVIVDITKNYEPKLNAEGKFTGNRETVVQIIRRYAKLDGRIITHTYSKSWNECVLAGWTEKDNWAKYPINMLKARAITDALALYCSDMLNGIYSLEEMADTLNIDYEIQEDGNSVMLDEHGDPISVFEK